MKNILSAAKVSTYHRTYRLYFIICYVPQETRNQFIFIRKIRLYLVRNINYIRLKRRFHAARSSLCSVTKRTIGLCWRIRCRICDMADIPSLINYACHGGRPLYVAFRDCNFCTGSKNANDNHGPPVVTTRSSYSFLLLQANSCSSPTVDCNLAYYVCD